MIRKYVVIRGPLDEEFSHKITDLLAQDWEPLGGVAVCPDGNVMQALGKRDGSKLSKMQSDMAKMLAEHDAKLLAKQGRL